MKMDEKSSKKNLVKDNKPASVPIQQRILEIIKSNWLAFACALAISILTIIVVPIVYSIEKTIQKSNDTNLSWDFDGKTILNGSDFIDNIDKNSFGIISSIFIDNNDFLYLVDKTKHRIVKYDFNTKQLRTIIGRNDGTSGSDDLSLNSPNDIYVSSITGDIYVADTFNHRIQFFQSGSNQGTRFFGTGHPLNESTNTINGLNQPMSITMDDNQTLYIADFKNNRILSIHTTNPNDKKIILALPDENRDRHEYVLTPISIKYSSKSSSLVIGQQTGYNAIRWKIGQSRWTLVAGSASSELSGTSRTLFNNVCSINVDISDNTYVNDCENTRIQFYQGDLTKGKTIAGVLQAPGNNSFLFLNPTSIALDNAKNLYVADSGNYRIQKFIQLN